MNSKLKSNRTLDILSAAAQGGYGVLAVIAYGPTVTIGSPC